MPPTSVWRDPKEPFHWTWTYEENPGVGSTEYGVRIGDGRIEWIYSEDRWGRTEEQSFAEFLARQRWH